MPGLVVACCVVQFVVARDPQRASERTSLRRELPAPLVVMQPRATARKP
jgi:hypothetical protein